MNIDRAGKTGLRESYQGESEIRESAFELLWTEEGRSTHLGTDEAVFEAIEEIANSYEECFRIFHSPTEEQVNAIKKHVMDCGDNLRETFWSDTALADDDD